jgi:putative flippase GtrA
MEPHRTSQIFSYLAVGGAATLAYVVACLLLTDFGFSPGLASIAGYLLMVPPAYFGQKIMTFRSSAGNRVAFPKYLALQAVGNIAGYFVSENLARAGVPLWAAFGMVAVMVATTNFIAMKYWAFRVRA